MTSKLVDRSPGGNGIIDLIWKMTTYLMTSIPIGEHHRSWLQLRHPINLHKGLSLIFVLSLMTIYDRFTYPAFAYAAVHGTYGIQWLLKEELYRDHSWEAPTTLGSAINLFVSMGIFFWSSPYYLITGGDEYEPTPTQVGILLILFIIGNWLHHTSDAQKYFVLRAKKGLITDGMFSKCRNPNYLGEMMIYASFAGFSWNHPNWLKPWLYLMAVWFGLFLPSWLAKDRSMSRYKEWPEYISRSGLIIPWPL